MTQEASIRNREGLRRVWWVRAVMVASLVGYTLYFNVCFGLSFDQPGMDGLWPVMWVLTFIGLVIAHVPAWISSRKVCEDPTVRPMRYVVATLLLYAIAITGVVIQGTDWEELALFLIPTVPSIVAVSVLFLWGAPDESCNDRSLRLDLDHDPVAERHRQRSCDR